VRRDSYNDGITRADVQVARDRGRLARASGEPIYHNPYPYMNAEYRVWENAYLAEERSEARESAS
jgi:hypothetical protein